MRKFLVIILLHTTGVVAAQVYNPSTILSTTTNPATNNVGIGIATPLETLHINGSVRGAAPGGALRISTPTGYLDLGSMNETWAHIQTDRPQFYFNKPIFVDGAISSYGGNNLILRTSSYPRIFVSGSSGYVAIGEYTPTAKLHIQQVANGWSDGLRLSNNGKNWDIVTDASGDRLLISKDQTQANTLSIYNGNIGVGVFSPSSKLDVVNGGQQVKFLTGTNSSGYTLEVGVNDNGVNLYNNSSSRGYNFSNQNGPLMSISHAGKVGIGTSDPWNALHVWGPKGDSGTGIIRVDAGEANASLRVGINTDYAWIQSFGSRPLYLNELGNSTILNHREGNVGIGTNNPTQKLTVKGTVYSTEVKVDVNAGTGPDYVFEPTYNLPTLAETEAYIKANKHLPEVPSAKEMETNGINLSEMNMLLLKKVEELTLHVIEQQKFFEEQQKVIQKQNERIAKLENRK